MKPLYASQMVEMRKSDRPSVDQDVEELEASCAPVGSKHRHTDFQKQLALPRKMEERHSFNPAVYNRLEQRFLNFLLSYTLKHY